MKCYIHEERDAVGMCVQCKKIVCGECTIRVNGKVLCKNCVEKINSKETKKNNIDVTKYDSKMNVAMIIMAVATAIFCISGINKNLDDFSYVWTRVGIYFRFGDYLF